MARWDSKAAATLAGNETMPCTQGGVDKRTSPQAIRNFPESKAANMASAATLNLASATGPYVSVTGTTTITALGTVQAGAHFTLHFQGALTLTHNATSLILPGAANIVTAAGDIAMFKSEGSGNWRCVGYLRANGLPLPVALDTDGTLAANSDSKIATQKAVKTYVDAAFAANDAMIFKGVIDCSTNPNYPAGSAGHTYRVSVAGKIGGASGNDVEAGDILLCLVDGSAAGDQATVGANWAAIQVDIDGALTVANIGVTVQQFSAVLDGLVGLTIAADKLIYGTGTNTFATTDLTSYIRTLLAATDAPAARATLNAAARDRLRGTLTSTAGATPWDMATGDDFLLVLTESTTLGTPTNLPANGCTREGHIIVRQDATGGRTLTAPAGTKWPNKLAAAVTTTANAEDRWGYSVYNNGGVAEVALFPSRDFG